MTRLTAAFGLTFLLTAPLFAGAPIARPRGQTYQEARVLEAGEVSYPIRSVAYGIVVLEVSLDAGGKVEDVQPLRRVHSLTSAAIQAVKEWKFSPAKVNGEPVRSRTTVAVVFSPRVNNPPEAVLSPMEEHRERGKQPVRFSPPSVSEAAYPRYPIRSVAWGTVVLELQIGDNGNTKRAKTVRGILALTSEAVRAAKQWKFQPALFDGGSVPSTMTVAFLFRPPFHSIR